MALSLDIEKRLGSFSLRVQLEAEREVLALLGASGCGKSMTLKCIAGIERPDRGRIVLDDRVLFDSQKRIDLPPQKRRVGYLFQQYALFPNMTVEQNVMAGARGPTKTARREIAREKLRAFRLEGMEEARPDRLSGGQQQRVALARILAGEPALLLLDEPFSALDEYLKWQLELEMSDTLNTFPGGVIFVSHNRDEVYRLCDTVCVLTQGKSDPKESIQDLFRTPQTVGAALISGCKNISPAQKRVDGSLFCQDWGVTLRTSLPMAEHTRYVGIRAHYFTVSGEENPIACQVERVIYNVFSTVVMLKPPGDGRLRLELEKADWAALKNPQQLTLHIRPEDVMPLTE